jgi:hypothetical protein
MSTMDRQVEADKFSLLRTEPESLPPKLASEIEAIEGIEDLAQRLPVVTPQLWAVPGPERICLVEGVDQGAGNFACSRLARVRRDGMFIASVPSDAPESSRIRTVIGLVPDGVTRVSIRASGVRAQFVPVMDNVFALRDHGRAFPESIDLIRGR